MAKEDTLPLDEDPGGDLVPFHGTRVPCSQTDLRRARLGRLDPSAAAVYG